MNKMLKTKLLNTLKAEAEYVLRSSQDIKERTKEMDDIFNITKIIENYEEMTPVIKQFLNEKAEKEKWSER